MKLVFKFLLSACGVVSAIWGAIVAVDVWFVEKANTVVEPTRKQVETLIIYDKALHESIEREMIHIRFYQQEQREMLREALNK